MNGLPVDLEIPRRFDGSGDGLFLGLQLAAGVAVGEHLIECGGVAGFGGFQEGVVSGADGGLIGGISPAHWPDSTLLRSSRVRRMVFMARLLFRR